MKKFHPPHAGRLQRLFRKGRLRQPETGVVSPGGSHLGSSSRFQTDLQIIAVAERIDGRTLPGAPGAAPDHFVGLWRYARSGIPVVTKLRDIAAHVVELQCVGTLSFHVRRRGDAVGRRNPSATKFAKGLSWLPAVRLKSANDHETMMCRLSGICNLWTTTAKRLPSTL